MACECQVEIGPGEWDCAAEVQDRQPCACLCHEPAPNADGSFPCRECGDTADPARLGAGPLLDLMRLKRLCVTCAYWTRRVEQFDPAFCAVVQGMHVMFGKEPGPATNRAHLGCGGQRFRLRFFNGREVETQNLWVQGEVPPHFRDRLPDTAVFVSG